MSIVGTRPPLISETNLYEPRHKARLAIKPGITGMWQVSGRSDITDFEEVVRLDKEYIENWDIGLDIKILLKTVMVVAKQARPARHFDEALQRLLFFNQIMWQTRGEECGGDYVHTGTFSGFRELIPSVHENHLQNEGEQRWC